MRCREVGEGWANARSCKADHLADRHTEAHWCTERPADTEHPAPSTHARANNHAKRGLPACFRFVHREASSPLSRESPGGLFQRHLECVSCAALQSLVQTTRDPRPQSPQALQPHPPPRQCSWSPLSLLGRVQLGFLGPCGTMHLSWPCAFCAPRTCPPSRMPSA